MARSPERWRAPALAALLILQGAAQAATPADCQAAYREHLASDLSLPYERFDQSEGQGFRALALLGCEKEAADLIEAYIAATNARDSSLRWHVAQLRAEQGANAEAVLQAKSVLDPHEDLAKDPLRWNDYVLATIAFLEHDREALVRHRDKVAEGQAAHFGNALNLKLLDSLVKHFDRDYRYATRHIGE
jgi:hypothetical protein